MLRHPEKLRGVHPNLILLMEIVGRTHDIVILEGARSIEAEREAIRTGHSDLTDPMNSKHVVDPVLRPLALAVDIAPDPIDWKNVAAFDALAVVVKTAAQTMGIAIHWGGDWSHLRDRPHYQLEG